MCGLMQECSHVFVCKCRDALMDQMSGRVNNLQDRDAILEAHRTARGYFHELEQQESDRIKEGYLSIIADLLKQVGDEDSSL